MDGDYFGTLRGVDGLEQDEGHRPAQTTMDQEFLAVLYNPPAWIVWVLVSPLSLGSAFDLSQIKSPKCALRH